jgi:hypothetical protein
MIDIPVGTPTPAPTQTNLGAGGSGAGSTTSNTDVMNTMLGTSWGVEAVADAQALGVNPSALAATCVIESGCQNVAGSGTVAGAFQMTSSTYTAMINQAVVQDPSLASQIVPGAAGQLDPNSEAIAASQYLIDGAQALESEGVSNPTVLQTRGYYNFGPSGAAIATATSDELMSQVMPTVSQQTLEENGVSETETVGQWEATVSAKIGNAANQTVLT